jgi:hypothetical protein
MRTPLILLALLPPLIAGEILVVTPTNDFAAATVESLATGLALKNPEPKLSQEGQLTTFTFKDVEPGKFRISYMGLDDPLGFYKTLMETLVSIDKNSSTTVYLFRPRDSELLKLPKDIEKFLTLHRDNLMELTAVYDGSKEPFVQARGGAWAIGYLRDDCGYSLKVWNHSFRDFPKDPKDRSVIYEKTFRTVAREMDPFAPGGVPHESDKKSEQDAPSNGG